MLKNKEYIGIKINKWTIMDYEKDEHGGKWLCRCECGEEKWQKVCNIKNGKSKMCIKCSGKERRKEKEPKKETIIKTRFDSNKEWSEENTFVGTYREYLEECKRRREEKRRNNRYIEYNGKTMTLKEWSEYYNIKSYTLSNRLKRGLTFEQSIQEKVPMVRTEKMKKKMQQKKEERRIKEEERQRIILIKKLKKALKNAMIYKAKELCNNIEKK